MKFTYNCLRDRFPASKSLESNKNYEDKLALNMKTWKQSEPEENIKERKHETKRQE